MWFDQADTQDLNLLAGYGVWGGVPAIPIRLPGLGRYGRYQFDRHILLQRNDLTVAQRRELIFLAEHFHKIDHFEFFELESEADDRQLKKSFFRFSKRFHPDQVSSLNLGSFTEHVRVVFEYGQQAYKLLIEDTPFREAYSRVTHLRDQAHLTKLESERAAIHSRLETARAQGIKPPRELRVGGTPIPIPQAEPSRSKEEVDQRKALLRDRLAQNNERRKSNEEARQSADLKSQARTFFIAGEQAERRGQLHRALNHFKLCAEYMPREPKYIEALRRVETQLAEARAAQIWSEAELMIASGEELKQQAASDLMVEACELSPNERRLITLSQQAIELDYVERVIPLLLAQHQVYELNLEYMWALVQSYETLKQLGEAKRYAEMMLSLDPSEPRALRFKKRYQ